MYLVVFYVGDYVWVCGCVGVYTKSKTSELSAPSEIASPLRSNNNNNNNIFFFFFFFWKKIVLKKLC
jgi:hypothetical protein